MIDESLIQRLRDIVGDEYVIWGSDDLLLYQYDGSIDRSAPGAVVLPGSADELEECVRVAYEYDANIVPRGAGTGLSGGAVPLHDSVVLPVTRLNKVLEVDVEKPSCARRTWSGQHTAFERGCSIWPVLRARPIIAGGPARSAEM